MPILFVYLGIKFYFFSNDHEPIHVHVKKGDDEARYQITPEVRLTNNWGMSERDLRIAEAAIEDNREIIISRWLEHFNKK